MNKDIYIYLAPLEGVTEIEFRNVFAAHFKGIDAAVAPFVSLAHHDSVEIKKSWDIPKIEEQRMHIIPQFMGRNISDFHHLSDWVKNRGYDELNWNLGCPIKRVVRRGRGCGTLNFPDEIRAFLDEVFKAPKVDFSIKTRLGMDEPEACFNLFSIYNQYPIKQIILHPRIGKQLYSGEVMLDYFEECLNLSKNELVYNGDIKTVADYQMIRNRFPSVDKIMIGRGLLKDPFLAEKIKGLSPEGCCPDLKRFAVFLNDLFENLESKFRNKNELLGKMKDFWRYFSHLFDNRNELFRRISRSQDLVEYQRIINELL